MSEKKQEVIATPLQPGTVHADLQPTAHLETPDIEQKPESPVTEEVREVNQVVMNKELPLAYRDYAILKEAAKIRQDTNRFMAAQTIGPLL